MRGGDLPGGAQGVSLSHSVQVAQGLGGHVPNLKQKKLWFFIKQWEL